MPTVNREGRNAKQDRVHQITGKNLIQCAWYTSRYTRKGKQQMKLNEPGMKILESLNF